MIIIRIDSTSGQVNALVNGEANPAPCILVIEDDIAVARSLRDGLSMDGYDVVVCYSGGQGMKSMPKDQPHLVILDVRLPDGSGFDFCRKIRQQGFYQPILILTVPGLTYRLSG